MPPLEACLHKEVENCSRRGCNPYFA